MTSSRYFAFAALVAVALVSFCFLIATFISPGAPTAAGARAGARHVFANDHNRDYREQLELMRVLHRRSLIAATTQSRGAVARESGPVMHAGVMMMLRMKSALPATVSATGVISPGPVSESDAKRVQNFLVLMELLIEMKADIESVMNHRSEPGDQSPAPGQQRRDGPPSLQVLSGAGEVNPGS
jgi:hypothetical protein